jgi:hypothetical protein
MSIDDRLSLVAEKKPLAALIWPWILMAFDDWGRAETSARQLKNKVFPAISMVTPEDIEAALNLYAQAGLIILYKINGRRYMCIEPMKWYKFQTHIHKSRRGEDKSRIPAPDLCAEVRGSARISVLPSFPPSLLSLSQRDHTKPLDPATIPAEGEAAAENALPATEIERDILKILKTVNGYPFNPETDLEFVRTVAKAFPEADLLDEASAWQVARIGKPMNLGANPRLAFRNWVKRGAIKRAETQGGMTLDDYPDLSDRMDRLRAQAAEADRQRGAKGASDGGTQGPVERGK